MKIKNLLFLVGCLILFVGCSEAHKSKIEILEYETPTADTNTINPEDVEDDNEIIEDTKEETAEQTQSDSAANQKEDVVITYPYEISVGFDFNDDLDGDGDQEYIFYSAITNNESANQSLSFIVDDKEYVNMLEDEIYLLTPADRYYITDLDVMDSYREIALLDYGPSEDLVSYFFRYEDKELHYIGSATGLVGDERFQMDGMGRIVTSGRLQVLQTWYAPFRYALNLDGKIELLPDELYFPYQYSDSEKVTLLKEIILYEERDFSSKKIKMLPSDARITFTKTDNLEWVYLEREDGISGWLNLTYYDSLRYGEDGTMYEEVFSGLLYAD